MANTSIYNSLLQRPKSIAEYDQEAMQGQTNRLTLQMNQAKMVEQQRGLQEEAGIADVHRSAVGADGQTDRNKLYSGMAAAGYGAKLQGMQKGYAELDEAAAKTKGETLKNDEAHIKNVNLKMGQVRDLFTTIQTPEQAAQLTRGMYADPDLGKLFSMKGDTVDAAILRIPTDPTKFAEWHQAASLKADELAKYRTPDANAKLQAKTATDNNNADNSVQMRGQNMTARTAAAGRAQSASQFNQRLAVDKGDMGPSGAKGGKAPAGYRWTADGDLVAIPGGPADLKNNAEFVKAGRDADSVLSLLDEADILLPSGTNGYFGTGVDKAIGVAGLSTKGGQASAQLRAIEGALIAKMPKMSGPQSDKDVLLYKQMAGQVGDSTIPREQRQAASKIIRKLNEKHATGATTAPKKVAPSLPSGWSVKEN